MLLLLLISSLELLNDDSFCCDDDKDDDDDENDLIVGEKDQDDDGKIGIGWKEIMEGAMNPMLMYKILHIFLKGIMVDNEDGYFIKCDDTEWVRLINTFCE